MHCKECGYPFAKGEEVCSQCGTPREGLNIDWNLNNFPEPGQVEDLGFNWNTGEFIKQEVQDEAREPADMGSSEPLPPDKPLDSLDRFFEFDKANDEFRQLLEAQQSRIEEFDSVVKPHLEREEFLPEKEACQGEDPEVIWLSQTTVEPDEPEVVEFVEPAVEEDSLEAEPEAEPELEAEPEAEPELEAEPEAEPELEPDEPIAEKPFIWMEDDGTEEEGEDYEISAASKAGEAILGIITIALIIIGLLFGSIIGIQHFKPESEAAEKAEQIQSAIIEMLAQGKDKISGWFSPKDTIDDGEGTDDPDQDLDDGADQEPDGDLDGIPDNPMDAIINSVSHLNENIRVVASNDTLIWEKGKNYGKESIASSQPVTEGREKIVGSLIEFNSKWIDYINDKNKDVIALTKKGSKARKNVESFSKVGKVKQDFLLMEIGEIRKSGNEYYAWVYEEISELKDGKAQTNIYNYVYSLENIDGNMLVTNYYKY